MSWYMIIKQIYAVLLTSLEKSGQNQSDRAVGLIAFCLMLNTICMLVLIQHYLEFKLIVQLNSWVKLSIASMIYFLFYWSVTKSIYQKSSSISYKDHSKTTTLHKIFTATWILGSIFIVVPITLFISSYNS